MTPTAKQLICEYIEIMPCLKNQTGFEIIKHARQCALTAVKHMIAVAIRYHDYGYHLELKELEEEIKNYDPCIHK